MRVDYQTPREITKQKRGRLAIEEWRQRTRYILRHLNDPIALQRSPICRLLTLESIARLKYPSGFVARGRTLHDIAQECLQEIESELEGHNGIHKFKTFITLTRQGNGVSAASRKLGISTEYGCRSFKKELVNLLAEKLISKLH
jgi:hypothetical protein